MGVACEWCAYLSLCTRLKSFKSWKTFVRSPKGEHFGHDSGHLYKHFCLRLLIIPLWLTVMMVYISCILPGLIGLIAALKPDIQQEVQENKLQGLQSLPTIPGVFIQQEVQKNKLQGLQSLPTVPEVIAVVALEWLPLVILIISAKSLPIYRNRTMYGSSLYLSILGVLTTFPLFSALLLTVSLDGASLLAALVLLLTNLVLLTATTLIKRLPSHGSIDWVFWVFFCDDIKFFKNLVVYFGIIIGVRNLLLEYLVLWKTW